MENPTTGYLEDVTVEIEWTIQDFETMMNIAEKCGSTKALQISMDYSQKPYLLNQVLEINNQWKFFIRRPKTGLCSFGVKREILNFQEEHDYENPFGIKVTFRIDNKEEGGPPILVESDMFYLKHGETKKFEARSTKGMVEASDFEMLTVIVKLEIYSNLWQSLNRLMELEDNMNMKEEIQEARTNLKAFYAQPELPYTDFTLRVAGDEDDYKTFKVNRCIIGAVSPVFKRMMENPQFIESNDECVTIIDLSAEAVQHLVDFMYGGDLNLSTDEEHRNTSAKIIMELIYAADKYELPALKILCDDELHNFFTPSNAHEMLDLCELHGLRLSSPKIAKYFDENILAILEEKNKQIRANNTTRLMFSELNIK